MTKPTASMKAKTPAKALLSKELVGDSDDEDAAPADRSTKAVVTQSATKPRPKKPETIPAKVNGVKRKSDQQSSSDESEDDDSSEDGSEQKIFGVKAKKAKIARGRHTETEEETSSEEDEDVPDVDLRPIGYVLHTFLKVVSGGLTIAQSYTDAQVERNRTTKHIHISASRAIQTSKRLHSIRPPSFEMSSISLI